MSTNRKRVTIQIKRATNGFIVGVTGMSKGARRITEESIHSSLGSAMDYVGALLPKAEKALRPDAETVAIANPETGEDEVPF